MKHKISFILTNEPPNDAAFLNIIAHFPDVYDQDTKHLAHLKRGEATQLEYRIIAEMRTTAARHDYGRNFVRKVVHSAVPGQVPDGGEKTPDEPPMNPSVPSASKLDPRVATSLAAFEKLQGTATSQTPSQNLADTMDIDNNENPPSSVNDEDEDQEDIIEREGIRSQGSGDSEEVDMAEEDD